MHRSLLALTAVVVVVVVVAACPAPPPPAPAPPPPSSSSQHADDYYTCPMHPSVHADRPGKCPVCGMELVHVAAHSDAVVVDAARRNAVGIATAPVVRGPMTTTIHALGHVAVDETRLRDVTVRVSGFVDDVAVDQVGMRVAAGQALFTITSPEIVALMAEYRHALASNDAAVVAVSKRRLD